MLSVAKINIPAENDHRGNELRARNSTAIARPAQNAAAVTKSRLAGLPFAASAVMSKHGSDM